ncbi:hypothetical protein AB0O90_17290 [Microbacterium testaceum]|uniref:hypothetical protein n=1 Tax=Microbacterium testaceum TaxID=2033 RepID=UPI0034145BD4
MPDDLSQLLYTARISALSLAALSASYGLMAMLKVFLAMVATFGRGKPRKNAERVLKILPTPKRTRGS